MAGLKVRDTIVDGRVGVIYRAPFARMSSSQGEKRLLQHMRSKCDIYDLHDQFARELVAFMETLGQTDRDFVNSWVFGHAFDKYSQKKKLAAWTSVFSHGPPTLQRDTIFYRCVVGRHAADLKNLAVGDSMSLDRYSSFSFHEEFVAKFCLSMMRSGVIISVVVKKGTPFLYADEARRSVDGKRIADTHGEVVLPPITLTKIRPNSEARICTDFKTQGRVRLQIAIVNMKQTKAARESSAS